MVEDDEGKVSETVTLEHERQASGSSEHDHTVDNDNNSDSDDMIGQVESVGSDYASESEEAVESLLMQVDGDGLRGQDASHGAAEGERIAATIDRLRMCDELTKLQDEGAAGTTATTSSETTSAGKDGVVSSAEESRTAMAAQEGDVETTDSREQRIRALREKCVDGLGEARFKRLYHFLDTMSQIKRQYGEGKDGEIGEDGSRSEDGATTDEVDDLVQERMAELAGDNGLPYIAKIEFLLALEHNDDDNDEVFV